MPKLASPSTQGVVSALVLLAFAAIAVLSFTHVIPPGNQAAQYVLTTLGTLATTVVSYWVGSSAGSAQKTGLLAAAAAGASVASAPPQVMPPLAGPKP